MMQEQSTDPTRFWQNRGGQLLKEEKERKVIQKVIIIYFSFVYYQLYKFYIIIICM